MPARMTKTTSYLKGLAETRARAAGDAVRLERLLAEVTGELARAKSDLEACDRLIRKFDPSLNPEVIEPIHARKGLYGKHGSLAATVAEAVRSAAPAPVTTWEVGVAVAMALSLEFVSRKDRARWLRNALGRCLRTAAAKGHIERVNDPLDDDDEARVRWRWADAECGTLDDLRRHAAANGATVVAQAPEADD